MTARISIRGKGAELFFGDQRDGSDAGSPDQPDARQTDSHVARQQARQQDSKHDSKTASKTARQTGAPMPSETERLRLLRESLHEEHPVHNTFRYSRRELERVRDIVYELEVKRRIKASRNDVMRLGLAWIIEDYRAHGADSVLVSVLKEEFGRSGL